MVFYIRRVENENIDCFFVLRRVEYFKIVNVLKLLSPLIHSNKFYSFVLPDNYILNVHYYLFRQVHIYNKLTRSAFNRYFQ